MISLTLDKEMPKCCGGCHFSDIESEVDIAGCAALGDISDWFYYESDGWENRHPECPLVEVIKPECRHDGKRMRTQITDVHDSVEYVDICMLCGKTEES